MSEGPDRSLPATSLVVLPRAEYSRKIFGSPVVHALIRSTYLMGMWFILLLSFTLGPVFLLPFIALCISRWRYAVTKHEKDVERNSEFIEKITRAVARESGIQLESQEVVRLWMRRMIISNNWVFTVKLADEDNFEIMGAELRGRE